MLLGLIASFINVFPGLNLSAIGFGNDLHTYSTSPDSNLINAGFGCKMPKSPALRYGSETYLVRSATNTQTLQTALPDMTDYSFN